MRNGDVSHRVSGDSQPPLPPMFRRLASVRPATYDEKANTVDVIFSTGAAVKRNGYTERLDMAPGAIDLAGFIGSAVLDSHRQGSLADVIGVVESARVEAGKLVGTVRLSSRPELAGTVGDIRGGVIRGVSLGYSVARWRDTTDAQGNRVRTAVSWSPREASFVPVPADSGATTRGLTMENDTTVETAEADEADPAATADRASVNQAIRTRGAAVGLSRAAVDSAIDRGLTVEQFSAEALNHMVQRSTPIRTARTIESVVHHDAPEDLVQRISAALHHRANPAAELPEPARQYRGLSLLQNIGILLESRGINARFMGPDELIRRAISTGDLPNLLLSTGNRQLLPAYQNAPTPLRQLARATTQTDFRGSSGIRFSTNGGLQPVLEGGEIKSLGLVEALASNYALSTYGGIVSMTRNAIINDSLGAFTILTGKLGLRAAELENGMLAALIVSNPNLEDGHALFSSQHGNLAGSGAAISTTTLSAARLALRNMKDVDGVTPISSVPRYLLVGPAQETAAEAVLASIYAATVDTVNVFSQRLTLLVEPRLSGNAWYIFSDPATVPVLEMAHLASAPGPQLSQEESWNTLGVNFRVVLDFACAPTDFRGAFKNPGQ